jgi:hypothetical protein
MLRGEPRLGEEEDDLRDDLSGLPLESITGYEDEREMDEGDGNLDGGSAVGNSGDEQGNGTDVNASVGSAG